jgi:hypothetical protein
MSERKAAESDIVVFCAKVQAMIDAHYAKHYTNLTSSKIVYTLGNKYVRIVSDDGGSGRSVYCFVQASNGDILKSESWKKPAKHPRGNIFNDNALQGCTVYGAEYMR